MPTIFLEKKLYKIFVCLWVIFFLAPPLTRGASVSLIEIAQNAMPAIVSIIAENGAMGQSPHAAAAIDKDTGRLVILRNVKAAYYKRSGAGVIISPSGFIVTNAHTVGGGGRVTVALHDGTSAPAKVVWVSPEDDLAFLIIQPPYPLTAMELADSNFVQLRDEVVTVGHSETLQQTISGGEVIGIGTDRLEKQRGNNATQLIQTNINIYKGDSGGALLNTQGQLIGLLTAGQIKADRSSFAIPSNKIKENYLKFATQPVNK